MFGLIIGSLFSLLPWGVEKANGLVDRNTALGLVDAVQIELERLGFSVVEHGTKGWMASMMLLMNPPMLIMVKLMH